MSQYTKLTNEELIVVLEKVESLTYSAKVKLMHEMKLRQLQAVYIEGFKDLMTSIDKETAEIKNFEYIKELGLRLQVLGDDMFKITRSNAAILIDLSAILSGFILFIYGLYGLGGLLSSFSSDSEFSAIGFAVNLGVTAVGFYGVKLLFIGINRFIDYAGFKLIIDNNITILRKRFDLKIKEIKNDSSVLKIKKIGDDTIFLLEEIEVLRINNTNLRQEKTLYELLRKINSSS